MHREDGSGPPARRVAQRRREASGIHREAAGLDIDQHRNGTGRSIAATVATAVCDTVNTSSPAPIPQARNASSIASVPLPAPTAWPIRAKWQTPLERLDLLPRMYWPLASTRATAASISAFCSR